MLEVKLDSFARRTDRRVVNPQLESVVRVSDQCLAVKIVDICRKGLRFKSKERYKPGAKLRFELESSNPAADLSLIIRGKVLYEYENAADNTYEYGVRFSRILNWYEMYRIHDFIYSYEKHRAQRSERRDLL